VYMRCSSDELEPLEMEEVMLLTDQMLLTHHITSYQVSHTEDAIWLKGIVSQDWGRRQMVLLDRSEVRTIPLDVLF
jgi:hypothetical protein